MPHCDIAPVVPHVLHRYCPANRPENQFKQNQPRRKNMAGKNTAAFGIFSDRERVEAAINALRDEGYRNTDISVLYPENVGTKDFAHQKNTKAPEGVTAGAGTGLVVGGALGWLAGIGAIAIPGIGPFIAAGPIMAALAGAGVGGTVGGVTGSLVGMGIPEYEAKRYEGRVRKGGYLLSVHCDDSEWVGRAKEILRLSGAEDISSSSEAAADFAQGNKPRPRGTRAGAGEPARRRIFAW